MIGGGDSSKRLFHRWHSVGLIHHLICRDAATKEVIENDAPVRRDTLLVTTKTA
jgi:hypothetical protein